VVVTEENSNFEIEISDAQLVDGREVKASISVKPVNKESSPYDEKVKVKGRTIAAFSNTVAEMYGLTDDEATQLKTDILKKKESIRTEAEKNQREKEKERRENSDEELFRLMEYIIRHGEDMEIELEELKEEFEDAELMADQYDEYVMVYAGMMAVTEEGHKRLMEYKGFQTFDGDAQHEAVKQLEDNPMGYYLDSFRKVHKGDPLLKIWEWISALSTKCGDLKIHSWAVGPSGKGKSHVKRRLCDCYLPEHTFIRKNSVSPKAMLYKAKEEGSDFLEGKLVYFDEVDDLEQVVTLMRSITDQEEDEIEHETVIDGQLVTMTFSTRDVTVWFTSVETIQDEQLKNRFILTNPDSSSDLDKKVYEHQKNLLHYGQDLDFIPKEAPVIQNMVSNIREETEDLTAIAPFEVEWKQKFNRRLYPYFYTLMGIVAMIHYKNRVVVDDKIIVTKADFNVAALVWSRLIDTTVAQQDRESIELLQELPDQKGEAMDTTELSMRLGSSFNPRKVRAKAKGLQESAEELNLIQSEKEEGRWVYWAGPDIDKLVNNEPVINDLSEDSIKEMLQNTPSHVNSDGIEATDEIIESVQKTEIEAYEKLKQKFKESKKRRNSQENDLPDVSEEEEKVLRQCHELGWEVQANQVGELMQENFEAADLLTDLEEREIVRFEDDKPKPTAVFDELREEGEVVM